MNRRHVLKLIGLATLASCQKRSEVNTFSSIAFGTEVHFQTHSIDPELFENVCSASSRRLAEIEALFSLYNPDSAISRLNRDGYLQNPDPEFLKLLHFALDMGRMTKGLFDITVQPLWQFRQKWKDADLAERIDLEKTPWEHALSLIDFRKIIANSERIHFVRKGMGITLNGIVQGYASDEIRRLLKEAGVQNAIVNIGEYAALGTAPDGKPWSVRIRSKARNDFTRSLQPETALAVSAGYGHIFDPSGRRHHIFHPASGESPSPESTILVTAPSATLADALATTLVVASAKDKDIISHNFPNIFFTEI